MHKLHVWEGLWVFLEPLTESSCDISDILLVFMS